MSNGEIDARHARLEIDAKWSLDRGGATPDPTDFTADEKAPRY